MSHTVSPPRESALACNETYECVMRIDVSGPVYHVAISPCGKLVAMGGDAGLAMHHIKSGKQVPGIGFDRMVYGPVTCLVWAQRPEAYTMLFAGTQDGWIVGFTLDESYKAKRLYHTRLAGGAEVMCLGMDLVGLTVQLVVGLGNQVVVRLECTDTKLKEVWGLQFEATVPRHVAFNGAGNILVYGMWDGMVHTISGSGKDDTIIESKHVARTILSATTKGNDLLIDHGYGIALMSVDSLATVATFMQDDENYGRRRRCPRQCAFLEDSTKVVAGGRFGEVYVYDRNGGHPKYIITHSADSPAEAISTYCDTEKSVIATATSAYAGDMSVAIWVRDIRPRRATQAQGRTPRNVNSVVRANNPPALSTFSWFIKRSAIIFTRLLVVSAIVLAIVILASRHQLNDMMTRVEKSMEGQVYNVDNYPPPAWHSTTAGEHMPSSEGKDDEKANLQPPQTRTKRPETYAHRLADQRPLHERIQDDLQGVFADFMHTVGRA